MPDTHYIIAQIDDETEEATELARRSRKDPAVDIAGELHLESPDSHMQVVTEAGTVVLDLPPVEIDPEAEDETEITTAEDVLEAATPEAAAGEVEALKEAGASDEVVEEAIRRTKPWSKTEVAKTFTAKEIEGYTLAYTRERTKTGIYRANDKSDWLVYDHRVEDEDYEGEKFENTTQARLRTNEMQDAYRAEVEQAKEEAKKEKAAKAKADKEAKAEAKAKEEKAKADKKAAADKAKADKAAAEAKDAEEEEDPADSETPMHETVDA